MDRYLYSHPAAAAAGGSVSICSFRPEVLPGQGALGSPCSACGGSFVALGARLQGPLRQRHTAEPAPLDLDRIRIVHTSIGLYADQLTAVMLVMVTFVCLLVHIYSIGYMQGDPSVLSVLRLAAALCLHHARAGAGRQLPADLLRMGRRRPLLLPADRLLLQAPVGCERREEGLHRQPDRRRWLRSRHHADLHHLWHAHVRR